MPFDLRASGEGGPPGDLPVLSVSELNRLVQGVLQECWPEVWVEGELSNFRAYSSGHWYFTLKDPDSELSGVMFRGHNRRCRFRPEDGMRVLARGGLGLYMARGQYQILVEELLPRGTGALQIAFEQLKKKLAAEGLFDEDRKKPLPMVPVRVGVATSRDGAALRDILRVLRRRYANVEILVAPCRVQGDEAAGEIAAALDLLDRQGGCDVLIVGRGGGSLEDLWAFNEEEVARAIAACRTPVISAVGHETDLTISDLVADLRSPTPSAAAEQVVDRRDALEERVEVLHRRLARSVAERLTRGRERTRSLHAERGGAMLRQRLRSLTQRLDELGLRMERVLRHTLDRRRDAVGSLARRVSPAGLKNHVERRRERVTALRAALGGAWRLGLGEDRRRLEGAAARLDAFSPLAVLDRGYALARKDGAILRSSEELGRGESFEVLLRRGGVRAEVLEILPEAGPPRHAGDEPKGPKGRE